MDAQRRDLVTSRARLEEQGEVFCCMHCGAELPPVWQGHTSDLCDACDNALEAELRAELAALV